MISTNEKDLYQSRLYCGVCAILKGGGKGKSLYPGTHLVRNVRSSGYGGEYSVRVQGYEFESESSMGRKPFFVIEINNNNHIPGRCLPEHVHRISAHDSYVHMDFFAMTKSKFVLDVRSRPLSDFL